MKTTATITDVQNALTSFIAAADEDTTLEAKSGKKLAGVVEYLTLKDGVTKDLNQAYNNAEKKWAVNFANDQDGCTKVNKAEKIKQYVCGTVAYSKHLSDPDTKDKVERWLSEKFPVMIIEETVDQAA